MMFYYKQKGICSTLLNSIKETTAQTLSYKDVCAKIRKCASTVHELVSSRAFSLLVSINRYFATLQNAESFSCEKIRQTKRTAN